MWQTSSSTSNTKEQCKGTTQAMQTMQVNKHTKKIKKIVIKND
jgi:hypothetical protein